MLRQQYVKAEKCKFHQNKVRFLGRVIKLEGIQMDDLNVKAVIDWPTPTTRCELQRFLGFAIMIIKGEIQLVGQCQEDI